MVDNEITVRMFLGRPAWMDEAECRGLDPALFFADRFSYGEVALAKKVCRDCQVRAECLAFAVESGETAGVWGGMSPEERRRTHRVVAR